MHIVRSAGDLEPALKRATREAQAYFGRPEVFLERYIDRAHHVEAQILADSHGTVFFLGERDCSVQRRHQKLIEETPSPVVDAELRARIGEAAMALAKDAGYVNAGTVEFIVDDDGNFYFLEMNTRLQVEHTVTEMVTGLDLVAYQIHIALGERIDLSSVRPQGHAIQCRINAEDPARNFLPGPGRVTGYREPSGPFVRVDSGVRQGKEIPADYDSMFAKLIVSGEDRERARRGCSAPSRSSRWRGSHHDPPPSSGSATSAFKKSTHTTSWLEQALRDVELPDGAAAPAPGSEPRPAVPAELLVELDGRRVPVRISISAAIPLPSLPRATPRTTVDPSTA